MIPFLETFELASLRCRIENLFRQDRRYDLRSANAVYCHATEKQIELLGSMQEYVLVSGDKAHSEFTSMGDQLYSLEIKRAEI